MNHGNNKIKKNPQIFISFNKEKKKKKKKKKLSLVFRTRQSTDIFISFGENISSIHFHQRFIVSEFNTIFVHDVNRVLD